MRTKLSIFLFLIVFAAACGVMTPSMTSFKTSKDADGKTASTTFKDGETLYANAEVGNSIEKTKTKIWLVDSKGTVVPGSEVTVELPSSGTAKYELPIPSGVSSGNFTLHAEMTNEKGDKKEKKSVEVKIEGSGPADSDDDSVGGKRKASDDDIEVLEPKTDDHGKDSKGSRNDDPNDKK